MNDLKMQSGSKLNDGFYELIYKEDGVYIVVNPPVGKGKKVETWEILDKLNRKQVKNFSKGAIELAVLKSDRVPVKIAESQQEAKVDSTASVVVSPDKMKAYITFTPPEGGRMLNAGEVVEILRQNCVVSGVSSEVLDNILRYPVFNEQILIAQGTQPVNGQNGKVEFYFDTSSDRKPAILEDGRVDYRELNLIESVEKGKALCSLLPPVAGKAGKTVMGYDIPALNGKPAVLPRGRNIEVSEDGKTLYAGIDGQVCYIDGKVNVFSIYEVHADVDTTTGNINFIGNVVVRGNVLSGFSIEAGGNVEVWGVVEGASIKAGGDIILRRGMQGMGKGYLKSGGDIIAKYIEHSIIEARNEIKAEAIMHSSIKCGEKLELLGKKGLLVGGVAKVGKLIHAKVIGSTMATVTELEVGVDPTLRERYKALKDEFTTIETDIKKADQAITILKKLESAGGLSPEKQELMAKSIRTKVHYSNRIEEIKVEIAQIEERLQQESQGKIKASATVYSGTKVAIGSCLMYVKENLQYCTLYRDGADIRICPYDR
ncbi:MAG TPA: FapA family protein [Pseudobacteroides sp.]|uniref:FapA family protein n=1 Tax=Pseudobacteroides sp. TaxID=1968840 RepID=UPI002F94D563